MPLHWTNSALVLTACDPNQLRHQDLTKLGQCLTSGASSTLEELHLGSCGIRDDDFRVLVTALAACMHPCAVAAPSAAAARSAAGTSSAAAAAAAATAAASSAAATAASPAAAGAVPTITPTALRVLVVDDNEIEETGLSHLARALRKGACPRLRTAVLADNRFESGGLGTQALARALQVRGGGGRVRGGGGEGWRGCAVGAQPREW
jgi:hypothetical protein